MRRFLGEDSCAPVVHPEILSGFGFRILGMRVPDNTRDTAATIIPSVGCPMGCNFCTTSAFFGGKGKTHHFYETGDQLFEVMQHMEQSLGVQSFFVMDENFLLEPSARAATAATDAGEQQELGALCIFVDQRDPQVLDGRTGTTRYFVDMGWAGVTPIRLREAEGLRHPHASSPNCVNMESRCWARQSSASSTTRRKIFSRTSTTPSHMAQISTSSCCTRQCRGRRFTIR